jgi:protein-tyrosine phosphatase
MKVLMVCLGNICRSPMAEGILRSKAKSKGISIQVDSCGTASYHVGERPDPRSIAKMKEHGIDISRFFGRQFSKDDFKDFDHILVMDKNNFQNVSRLARGQHDLNKVDFILNYVNPDSDHDVPDPYYGEEDGFEKVYQMLNEASDLFISKHFNV